MYVLTRCNLQRVQVLQNLTSRCWVWREDWGKMDRWTISLVWYFISLYFFCHHSTWHFPAPCYPLLFIYHIPYLILCMTLYWSTHYVFLACLSTLFLWLYTLALLNDAINWCRVSWCILVLKNISDTSVICFRYFWVNKSRFCLFLPIIPSYSALQISLFIPFSFMIPSLVFLDYWFPESAWMSSSTISYLLNDFKI
jgi:hypothetical protein